MLMKICSRCGEDKDFSFFNKDASRKDGFHPYCKSCKQQENQKYYKDNKQKISENTKVYYDINKTELLQQQKGYYQDNKQERLMYQKEYRDNHKEKRNEYEKNRRSRDIYHRLRGNLRSRLRMAIKSGQKSGSAVQDLGCSIEDLKVWLEKQFQPGMIWENYGQWEIDHVIPLSMVDLRDQKQLRKVCNWFNLQPLWSKENISKGNKINET